MRSSLGWPGKGSPPNTLLRSSEVLPRGEDGGASQLAGQRKRLKRRGVERVVYVQRDKKKADKTYVKWSRSPPAASTRRCTSFVTSNILARSGHRGREGCEYPGDIEGEEGREGEMSEGVKSGIGKSMGQGGGHKGE